jgi:hypothetical protein
MRFRDDQGKIEESILATLDKINQFGEALSKNLKKKPSGLKAAAKEISEQKLPPQQTTADPAPTDSSVDGKVCFEIPAAESETTDDETDEETMDDIEDPLDDTEDGIEDGIIEESFSDEDEPAENEELDIF